jgi:serine/threonine-protein kinase
MQAAVQLPVAADERVQRALSQVGQIVRDRWHLDAVLGVGGTAAVFAATHRNGKRVALKMLHRELSSSSEMRQRFVDEGYVANCVGHPGAVSVIDDDETDDGHVFLIMDLLEGETLDQLVGEGGWLLPSRVLTVADAVLDILAAAHDKQIVHRDVKPDNIFITRDGTVRLLDFGIARLTAPGRSHTTQMGTPLGTPAFMPPEQARGRLEQLDGRTDLWALGATMFFLLTGRDVHEADTVAEELLAAMTKPAPSLGEVAPHLPEPLIELVDRALAFERSDRWASAREMQAAVRELEELLATNATVPTSRRKRVAPASPTLVTPSLAPATSSVFPGARAARPLTIIAVSAAVSFAALLAVRQLGRGFRSSGAHALEVAEQQVRADRVVHPEGEQWLDLAPPPRETPAPANSSSVPSPAESVAARASGARPKPVTRPLQEARTWIASSGRSPATSLSPEPAGAAVPADPLDRRK